MDGIEVVIIVAMDRHRCIGEVGALPWRLPGEMAHFRVTTMGSPVIMGRRTWESLPGALERRTQVVLSRQDLEIDGAGLLAPDLDTALRRAAVHLHAHDPDNATVYIVGGGAVYTEAIPLADRVLVTEIDAEVVDGDTWFPALPADEWSRVEVGEWQQDERDAHRWRVVEWERI